MLASWLIFKFLSERLFGILTKLLGRSKDKFDVLSKTGTNLASWRGLRAFYKLVWSILITSRLFFNFDRLISLAVLIFNWLWFLIIFLNRHLMGFLQDPFLLLFLILIFAWLFRFFLAFDTGYLLLAWERSAEFLLLLLNQELRLPSIALKWFSYDPLCEYALPEDDLTIAGLTVALSPKSYVYVLVS